MLWNRNGGKSHSIHVIILYPSLYLMTASSLRSVYSFISSCSAFLSFSGQSCVYTLPNHVLMEVCRTNLRMRSWWFWQRLSRKYVQKKKFARAWSYLEYVLPAGPMDIVSFQDDFRTRDVKVWPAMDTHAHSANNHPKHLVHTTTSLSPIPSLNSTFFNGMGLRLVNGIPCLSAFSGVDRGGHH